MKSLTFKMLFLKDSSISPNSNVCKPKQHQNEVISETNSQTFKNSAFKFIADMDVEKSGG